MFPVFTKSIGAPHAAFPSSSLIRRGYPNTSWIRIVFLLLFLFYPMHSPLDLEMQLSVVIGYT